MGVVVNKQHHNHSAGGGYELYAGDGDVGRYPIEQFYDDDLAWREEGFGEHPVLNPLGIPFYRLWVTRFTMRSRWSAGWRSLRCASRVSRV